METTHIYLTTEQAIEESKKQDGLIPSEFLSTFPNNFGINLCAIKGFNIEMTEDKQYKSITVDFIPKTETIDERIKKEIIQFLQLPHPQFVGKRNHEEWIAWLEKPKYTEEDLDKAYKCADEVQYRRGYEDAKKELEKQGEQTRIDAFIEKACEWLTDNLTNYYLNPVILNDVIHDFKQAMKGE